MNTIIENVASEDVKSVAIDGNKIFAEAYEKVYDYLMSFYQNMVDIYGENVSYADVACDMDLEHKSQHFTLMNRDMPDFVKDKFDKEWFFFRMLFQAAKDNEAMDEKKLDKAYKFWILSYLRFYTAPQHLHFLMQVSDEPDDERFYQAFFRLGAKRIYVDGFVNSFLVLMMVLKWYSCPRITRFRVAWDVYCQAFLRKRNGDIDLLFNRIGLSFSKAMMLVVLFGFGLVFFCLKGCVF